ncbi:MAG: hypothetical protein AABZ74_06950 [Cyanobacteriota bacterium]
MSNLESFYSTARILKEEGFYEGKESLENVNACKRFYVSRLYYAIFHGAKQTIIAISSDLPEEDRFKENIKEVHGQVKGFFSFLLANYPEHNERYRFKRLTSNISKLHKFRKICDYTEGNIEKLEQIVEDAEFLAEDSYVRLKKILSWIENRE